MSREEVGGAKIREVKQLLWNMAAYYAAFGGGVGYDTMQAMGQYGPAGMIFSGQEFKHLTGYEKHLLRESIGHVHVAMRALRKLGQQEIAKDSTGEPVTGFGAWQQLADPYLYDPPDPHKVDDWRRKAAKGSIACRRLAEKHDAGVRWLARRLENTDLYPVYPKLMSEHEERKMEDANAAIYHYYCRLKRAGVAEKAALERTADYFGFPSAERVECIVEFRSENKPDTCLWNEPNKCERVPYSQGLCSKHYQERRAAQKGAKTRA